MTGGLFLSTHEELELRIIEDYRAGRINRSEASLLLGVSCRSVTRWAKAVRQEGPRGIKHGNSNREPKNKFSEDERDKVLELARKIYRDFNLAHMHEKLHAQHGIRASYDTVRRWCNEAGIGRRRKRRPGKARMYRERLANEGLMLQMDGSHHVWYGNKERCLIAAIDDATSRIPAADFFPGETTWACFAILRRIVETQGIPEIIYVDGAGWAGGGHKRQFFSQFVRACQNLGSRVVHARSPQAKGRIERAFRTMQDRLVNELAHHNITGDIDASRYLNQVFLPAYWNAELTVVPRDDASRYRMVPPGMNLDKVFSFQFERLVGASNTVSLDGQLYRIEVNALGSLKGKIITACKSENDAISWYYGEEPLKVTKIQKPTRQWIKAIS